MELVVNSVRSIGLREPVLVDPRQEVLQLRRHAWVFDGFVLQYPKKIKFRPVIRFDKSFKLFDVD